MNKQENSNGKQKNKFGYSGPDMLGWLVKASYFILTYSLTCNSVQQKERNFITTFL